VNTPASGYIGIAGIRIGLANSDRYIEQCFSLPGRSRSPMSRVRASLF